MLQHFSFACELLFLAHSPSDQGKNNPTAGPLSRLQFQRFRRLAPLVDREATPIPPIPDPWINCLRLQGFPRGIKPVQGSPIPSRLPITMELMRDLQKGLGP